MIFTLVELGAVDSARYNAFLRTGTLRLGMTKTQVLLTRGYPPGHETSSLDLPVWKYWSSRFIIHSLAFDGDILSKARGVD